MDSDEDSDEAEDTINVAPIDLTGSDSLPPRGTRARGRGRVRAPALEAVDSSDEAPESEEAPDCEEAPESSEEAADSEEAPEYEEAPESSDDVVVLDSQPPAPTSSANPNRTKKRKRTVRRPPSTPPPARSQGQSTPALWNRARTDQVMEWFKDCKELGYLNSSKKKDYGQAWDYVVENCQGAWQGID